jgi:hypothetical protein
MEEEESKRGREEERKRERLEKFSQTSAYENLNKIMCICMNFKYIALFSLRQHISVQFTISFFFYPLITIILEN